MRCEWKAECCTSPRSQERTMSGRKRTLKLGWRELWPVWVVFGILIAIGIVGMQVMFPPPARPKALLAGEDLTLNLADLEPAKIHLFSYPATLQNQAEFFVERSPASGVYCCLRFLPALLPLRPLPASGPAPVRLL